MKRRITAQTLLASLALVGFACGAAVAQDSYKADPHKKGDHADQHAMSPEAAAEMEAWMKAATPGEHHQRLNYFVGSWNVTVKSYMGGPEPMTSSGSSNVEWIMDGRYIKDTFKGDFMGMPFQGMGITGYDNIQGHYVGLWIDNMGTGFMTSKGTWDQATKTYTFKAAYPDAMNPGKMKKLKEVLKIVSDTEYTFTMYDTSEDGEPKLEMEITYKRS